MGLEYVTENIIYESKLSKSYQDIWIGHLSLKLTQSNWIAYVKILLPYPLNNRHELKLAKLILYCSRVTPTPSFKHIINPCELLRENCYNDHTWFLSYQGSIYTE